MDSDVLETVTGWEERPFDGGYAGLSDLAAAEFTGAVSADMAWAFFVNGRVVGVFEGTIESFENADGTAYTAPDPSLPLLFTMREQGGETRASYYTNETSVSEADATLKSGNFTGYIELAENVLSGDYYVVYHGGKSMSAAFVGNNRTLLTGEEAFERADDEVGIFEVKAVDVNVVEIPEPEEPEPESADEATEQEDVTFGAAGAAGATDPAETAGSAAADADAPDESVAADTAAATDTSEHEAEPAADEAAGSEAADPLSDPIAETEEVAAETPTDPTPSEAEAEAHAAAEQASDDPSSSGVENGADTGEHHESGDPSDPTPAVDDAESDPSESTAETPANEPEPTEETDADAASAAASAVERATPDAARSAANGVTDPDVFSEEAEWRNAKSIPALDPEETEVNEQSDGDRQRRRRVQRRRQAAKANRTPNESKSSQRGQPRQTQQSGRTQKDTQSQQAAAQTQQSTSASAELEQRLERAVAAKKTAETERQQAVERLSEVESERDEQRERADRLAESVERLEAEVDELESKLAAADSAEEDAGSSPAETMGRKEALDGTNLFVRYGTKSGGTLEKAHAGEVDRAEVVENLRLEHHTRFETDDLHVEGEPYEAFLEGTVEYGFVRWVVDELLYEIRDTGNVAAMQELFDAIPKIDRAELGGDVSVQFVENGEQHREQRTFDVVLRDRMGNPLLVADLNDSRAAASEAMMSSLIQNAGQVAETSDSLGASFLVTTSYFEPEALETAADATGGGLLSRGKRKSLVRLTRKRGFHLCLVETRNGDFHLNVPEL
ncbi:hypothetical protein AUR64_10935 [Haloprofundus marisrubri]|uniref:DUF7527 domain-containing protein n=1 Tax=Haloprofundus marisrubri TaxID=1514971 RepID=A0A0W1R9R9_9EURY|nr:hypothetical protein [Haloprofundus marisrubri]KTG10103.1 hypothetical protein AUR64_10935 [Haloprofundus marisrubri]